MFPGRRAFASRAGASLLLTAIAAGSAAAGTSSAWGELLARHVRPGTIGSVRLNVVDYAALRGNPLLEKALADFATADPGSLPGDADRQAFWINAYNLLAVKTVVDHYPLAGIRDAGSLLWPVWKRTAGVVAGKAYSLDEIEHGILGPRFADPRTHFAIVCASVSCPDLRVEPYEGARLSGQLDEATRAFLANPSKGIAIEEAAPRMAVSSIFRWFAEDFAKSGGVVAFVRSKADAEAAARAARFRDADLEWLDYDWSLNDAARAR